MEKHFYEDYDIAQGVNDYLAIYGGYNGGRIGLKEIIEWPLKQPILCAHAINVSPPYAIDIYKGNDNSIFADGFDFL